MTPPRSFVLFKQRKGLAGISGTATRGGYLIPRKPPAFSGLSSDSNQSRLSKSTLHNGIGDSARCAAAARQVDTLMNGMA
ncbi:RutC family protein YjgH [Fusarium oxysporum f. sp. albedinis]|nr:RutC family protein YjgH [Fusarium oxysporum f. sp. albedinis]